MQKCINDPKKSYKSLGYCAHTEEIGTIKMD